ncbi:MAG: cupin domain-containing protein [Geminicoccaceae bacterium]
MVRPIRPRRPRPRRPRRSAGASGSRAPNGRCEVLIDGSRHRIEDDFALIVPAGARHNVINTGDEPLKLYTLYGPPEHRDGVVHRTKAQAQAEHEHFDGNTTE